MFQYFENLKNANELRGVLHGMKMYCSDLKRYLGLNMRNANEPWRNVKEFNPVNSAIHHSKSKTYSDIKEHTN